MPTLGFLELLVIFMIIMLVFGASRLPQIGEGMGRAIKNFKQGMSDEDKIQVTTKKVATDSSEKPSASEPADAEIIDS